MSPDGVPAERTPGKRGRPSSPPPADEEGCTAPVEPAAASDPAPAEPASANPVQPADLLSSRDHYRLRKRLPHRPATSKTDIYVTRSARFQALIGRCVRLLDKGDAPTLHAMGAAIEGACEVALAVKARARGEVVVGVKTGTVVVVDDYEPIVPVRFRVSFVVLFSFDRGADLVTSL